MPNRPPSDRIKLSDFSEDDQPSRYQILKVVDKVKTLAEEQVQIAKEVKELDEHANRQISEVKTKVETVTEKLDEVVTWKKIITSLLQGDKGEFAYFQKTNILWKIIIFWPMILLSTAFGALLTIWLQRMFK